MSCSESPRRRAAPGTARRLGLSEQDIRLYFRVIRRSLDQSDMDGQDRFMSEFEKHFTDTVGCPLPSPVQPIDIPGFKRRIPGQMEP